MSKPIVAVVGRPNVGKSTLFNKLCGQRLAIVEDTPGITRDRIFANCEWSGHEFLLVDTGGIEPKATEGILAHMREQAQIAIDTADCIIIADGTLRVIDYKHGLGVLVSADENPQMQCYALGALELFDDIYDIDTVSMTIYQPRRQNVSTYEISKDDLYH